MNVLEKLNLQLHSLVIFRSLLSERVIKRLINLLSCTSKTSLVQVKCYTAFVSTLFQENDNLSDYILNQIIVNENFYVLKCAQDQQINPNLEECLKNELEILQCISQLRSDEVKKYLQYEDYLPIWKNSTIDLSNSYIKRLQEIKLYGYGIFAMYHMFKIIDSEVVPVENPDKIELNQLKGYQHERQIVINNTLALLNCKPAANVLLYGAAGAGKSSTVKAIVNEFKGRGLRLIEISKNQLNNIPFILDKLYNNPLKFILFIDDLSFSKEQDDFSSLKAILEGSVSAKPNNVVIYATSNRRHLIKETFADREGDDIHHNETMQEQVALSDRFGLSVNFFKPDKNQYLKIIQELALEHEIMISADILELEAERYALRRSGRSPRVAKQFIDYLIVKENSL